MHTIAVLPGDGVGREVIAEAKKALSKVSQRFDRQFTLLEYDVGGGSIEKTQTPMTDDVLEACKRSDAVLLGAVGGSEWDSLPLESRPEYALLQLRKELNCFANLRPIRSYHSLLDQIPIKRESIGRGVDLLVCRELLGGLYYGERGTLIAENGVEEAFDTAVYSADAVRRVSRVAFETARSRRNKVTSIDKSNILATSRLWRKTVTDVGSGYPDCALNHQIIDTASMRLILEPTEYDVILVNNEYGDILSEEASVLTASHGLIPSASIGEHPPFIFEPMHGSAPDIAGLGIANPIGAILSAAMLLRFNFGYEREASAIELAVETALERGYRTRDIARFGERTRTTGEMGDYIVELIGDSPRD
jgi:3-isopropylmalate dehydrogenase